MDLRNEPPTEYQFRLSAAQIKLSSSEEITLPSKAKSAQDSQAEAAARGNHQPEATPPPAHRRRRWMVLFAIAVGFVPFVLLEAGLRLFDVGAEEADLHAGFGETSALFQIDPQEDVYRTSLAKLQFFVTQQFPVAPAKEEFRIFVLGGSTVQGRPFGPPTSFAKWLELHLQADDPSCKYRAINCGGISYASYRLQPVLQEVLNYQPDLIVLATGHNEFLEDRTYAALKSRSALRLWLEQSAGQLRTVMLLRRVFGVAPKVEPTDDERPIGEAVEARLDDEAGYASYHRDAEWHRLVCQQYEDSVRQMVDTCRTASVPLVLVKLGANLRDCAPFKSELDASIDLPKQQEWQRLFDQATVVQTNDAAGALKLYEQLLEIDPLHSLVHFRAARCQERLGLTNEAAESYQRALNNDVCPLRMPEQLSDVLAKVAADTHTPLIDADTAIREVFRVPSTIPGYDRYLDHVHPTIASHQRIARRITETAQGEGLVAKPVTRSSSSAMREIYRNHLTSLPHAYASNGRRRIGWLEGWAQRQRLLEETAPFDAAGEIAATMRYLEISDPETAREHLLKAITQDGDSSGHFLSVALDLFESGQSHAAVWILTELSSENDSGAIGHSIALARLVIACDDKKPRLVRELYTEHQSSWPAILDAEQSGWQTVMPDVLERATALAGP